MSRVVEEAVRASSPLAGALSIAECVNTMTFLWLHQKANQAEQQPQRRSFPKSAARIWNRRIRKEENLLSTSTSGLGYTSDTTDDVSLPVSGGEYQMTTTAAVRGGDQRSPLLTKFEKMGSPRRGDVVAMATVPEGATPVMYACQQSRPKELCDMLEAKPGSVRDRDRTLKTALHYCAENARLDCAELLTSVAPDLLDARDEDGYTPLHLAVISGNISLVRFLLSKGASLDCLDNERHSLVHWATVCGELEALQAVLEAGAEPSSPDMHGGYPVHYAAQMCGPGSEVTSDTTVGMSVLSTLLEHKVPVNVTDKDGRQPILWAASAGSADAILALVNAGANVEAEDKDGLTALHCAASRGHSECLETLITLCGAQVDLMDSNGCSPLFYAVTLGHADATRILLTLGAQPNRQDRKGRTPAHCGAAKGQVETLRLLAQHDADLWMRNVKGDYALHEAVASGRKELVTWLLSQRPDTVNAANNDGRCPLHIAAIYNNVQMCKILLDAESLVNPVTRSTKGQLMTPLDAALYKGNRGCAKYLQLHGGVPANKLTPEAAALRGVSNKTEAELKSPRSDQETPSADMLKVPQKEKKEVTKSLTPTSQKEANQSRLLATSPVTITGNRQLTLVDTNNQIVQLHVEGEVQVSRQDEKDDAVDTEEERRKRRRKRQQRREEEDDYGSEDSERRRRRRRRRREKEDYSSEEDEDDSESRGRRRRGSRRDRSEESEEESDDSERGHRRRKSKDRRSKRSKKERKSSVRRDRSEDIDEEDTRKKRKSGKSKERTKVIKEETKRKEVITSKKIIEEKEGDNDDNLGTPNVSKTSVTTSEERKCEEKIIKSVSEVIDGQDDESKSENDSQETVQVVEAMVHREEVQSQGDDKDAPTETQEPGVEKTDDSEVEKAAPSGAEETDKPERKEKKKSEESSNRKGKSKLKRMNKEMHPSKTSDPGMTKLIDQLTEKKDPTEASTPAAATEPPPQEEKVESEEKETVSEQQEVTETKTDPEPVQSETAEPEPEPESDHEEPKEVAAEPETTESESKTEELLESKTDLEQIEETKEEIVPLKVEETIDVPTEEEKSEISEQKEPEKIEPIEIKEKPSEADIEKPVDSPETEATMEEPVETQSEIPEENKEIDIKPKTPEEKKEIDIKPKTPEEKKEIDIKPKTPEEKKEVELKPKTPEEKKEVKIKPKTPEETTPSIDPTLPEAEDYVDEKHVVSPEREPETVVEKIVEAEDRDDKEEKKPPKEKKKKKKDIERKPSKELLEKQIEESEDDKTDHSDSENDLRKSFETVVERTEYKRKFLKEKKKSKSKKDLNVSLSNIVDESTAKVEDDQDDISEEDQTIYSGDDGSLDAESGGRALVRIIGRAHEERGRRRRRRNSGDRAPTRARSSFSIVSDTLSTHLDSGFEPSPRVDKPRETRESRRDRSAGPELTAASVTQAVQHSIRRYHLERKIFHELLELKRLQIRAGRSNEAVLVKRLAEEYRKAALDVGLVPYQGPYAFRTFENYLYDQLRRLQLAERKMIPRLKSTDDLEKLTAALSKTRAGKAFLESVPDNPMCCTHSTHRCFHATHAYTGIPCAAYITKSNHHTVAKPPRSGFLPRIESEKRTKEGQGAEIARCLRYVDPSRPVTLELSHGKERQVISLPTENLDKNKRYYVTFTIKGGEPVPEPMPGDENKHRHAKSF